MRSNPCKANLSGLVLFKLFSCIVKQIVWFLAAFSINKVSVRKNKMKGNRKKLRGILQQEEKITHCEKRLKN